MTAMGHRPSLPDQFELRFIAGRVLRFLPVLVAAGGLGWAMNSRWAPLLLAKYFLILGLIGWISYRKAVHERIRIEGFLREDPAFSTADAVDNATSHAVPLLIAAVAGGGLWALIRGDIRWMYLAGGLGLLIGVGLLFGWLVYERWVTAQLRAL
jgi:hypothetical protein